MKRNKMISIAIGLTIILGSFTYFYVEQAKPDPTSKMFVIITDTHTGGTDIDGNAVDDEDDMLSAIQGFHTPIDYIFHLGDITDVALDAQFTTWHNSYEANILSNDTVLADRIWYIGGMNHDGLYYRASDTQYQFRSGLFRILNQTTQYYTLKIGNNVFIFCTDYCRDNIWASGSYGGSTSEKSAIFGQNKIDWLEAQLEKWNGTGNNIFICKHVPQYKTDIVSTYGGHCEYERDRTYYEFTEKMKPLLENYTDLVAIFHGHEMVESNSTIGYDNDGMRGTVFNSSLDGRWSLSNFYVINCAGIWDEHSPLSGDNQPVGCGSQSYQSDPYFHGGCDEGSFRYFNMTDGNNYFTLESYNIGSNGGTPGKGTITYANDTTPVSSVRIELKHAIQDISDPVEFYPGWDVCRYSDESNSNDYMEDIYGWEIDNTEWIEGILDYWEVKNFSNCYFNKSTTNDQYLSYTIWHSNSFDESNAYNAGGTGATWANDWYTDSNYTSMPDSQYVKIRVTASGGTGYVGELGFDFGDVVVINSINNQANNTSILSGNRYFNCTAISGAYCYQLQIANGTDGNPDWNDIIINITNLTVENGWCTNSWLNTTDSQSPYAYNYWENGSYFTFYLPNAYNITYTNKYHFYRVRAYS